MNVPKQLSEIGDLPADFLRLLIDAAPILISYIDTEQRYRFHNQAYIDWFGLSEDQILGKHVADVVGNAAYEAVQHHFEAALSGQIVVYETQMRYQNGAFPYVHTTLVPHLNSRTGQVQGLMLFVSDTTELHQTQQRLIAAYSRVMLIGQIGRAARSASAPQSILQIAVNTLGETLQVDRCYYVTYDQDLDQGTIAPEWYRDGLTPIAGRYKMSDYNINKNIDYREGQTHVIEDTYDLADQSMADRYGLRSLLRVPLQQGSVMTALSVAMSATPRHWTSDEIALVETVATQTRAAVESARASQRERSFLRDVLCSVTEGKLRLLDHAEQLPAAKALFSPEVSLMANSGLRELRVRITEASERAAHTDERLSDLVTAAGEASMNAVVHAGGGNARVCMDDSGAIQVWIEDTGTGIAFEDIPRATLEKGWSSGSSLGHGFWLMLKTVDRIWLLTGSTGTIVVLEQDRIAPGPAWLGDIAF